MVWTGALFAGVKPSGWMSPEDGGELHPAGVFPRADIVLGAVLFNIFNNDLDQVHFQSVCRQNQC